MEYPYKIVGCGGTFDRLHNGHKMFLRFVFSQGQNVIIGLTSEKFIFQHKKKKDILSFEKRQEDLRNFLQKQKLLKRTKIIPIDDIYGTARDNSESIEALIVTEDTLSGAEAVNALRVQSGFPLLPIIAMPIVRVAHIPISSSHIRKGIMNMDGDLLLPDSLREVLRKPFGKVMTDFSFIRKLASQKIVTIGDVTTKTCNDLDIGQKFSVIDFTVRRKKTQKSLRKLGFNGSEQVLYVKNPAGHITWFLWQTVKSVIERRKEHKRSIIVVDGEEDLSVVPFVLLLPSGWYILYGQPNQGIVYIKVTAKIKAECLRICSLFEANPARSTRGY